MSARSLASPLGVGHTAEVYLWDEGTVLKLFYEGYPLDAIEREAQIARRVHDVGLPTPSVIGGIIKANGRYGLGYERVRGGSMLDMLVSQPESLVRYANLQAKLQADLHSRTGIEGVPNQRGKLRAMIQSVRLLTRDRRSTVLDLLDGLPEGNQLCHGDFHPGNLLLTGDGPVIIDWMDATLGNPVADVARSSLLISEGQLPEDDPMSKQLARFRGQFHQAYLNRYFQLRPVDGTEFDRWRLVVAAARLSEGIREEQALLRLIETGLAQ